MTQLYKLTGQIKELNDLADDPDMVLAVKDTLESLTMELSDKAESITHLITNRNTDIESIDIEIKRLTARKNTIKNFQDGLKEYLRENMEASGVKKITRPLFTITLAKGREICVIDNQDDLEDDYINIKMVASPIKADILKALKDGVEVKGAHIETSKTSLRIK